MTTLDQERVSNQLFANVRAPTNCNVESNTIADVRDWALKILRECNQCAEGKGTEAHKVCALEATAVWGPKKSFFFGCPWLSCVCRIEMADLSSGSSSSSSSPACACRSSAPRPQARIHPLGRTGQDARQCMPTGGRSGTVPQG